MNYVHQNPATTRQSTTVVFPAWTFATASASTASNWLASSTLRAGGAEQLAEMGHAKP